MLCHEREAQRDLVGHPDEGAQRRGGGRRHPSRSSPAVIATQVERIPERLLERLHHEKEAGAGALRGEFPPDLERLYSGAVSFLDAHAVHARYVPRAPVDQTRGVPPAHIDELPQPVQGSDLVQKLFGTRASMQDLYCHRGSPPVLVGEETDANTAELAAVADSIEVELAELEVP